MNFGILTPTSFSYSIFKNSVGVHSEHSKNPTSWLTCTSYMNLGFMQDSTQFQCKFSISTNYFRKFVNFFTNLLAHLYVLMHWQFSVCLSVTVYFLNTIGHCFMNSDLKWLNFELINK